MCMCALCIGRPTNNWVCFDTLCVNAPYRHQPMVSVYHIYISVYGWLHPVIFENATLDSSTKNIVLFTLVMEIFSKSTWNS